MAEKPRIMPAAKEDWSKTADFLAREMEREPTFQDTALSPLRKSTLRYVYSELAPLAPSDHALDIARSVTGHILSRYVDLMAFTSAKFSVEQDKNISQQWLDVLRAYPALNQGIAIRLMLTVRSVRVILENRERHRLRLSDDFAIDPSDEIANIAIGLGDAHYGGATVSRIHFKSGKTLIYKPRSASSAMAFRQIHDLVSGRLPGELRLRFPKILHGGNHTWEEEVAQEDCRTTSEVEQFYRRAGLLLAICQLCRSADMHNENIIATGPNPVPIDTEAFAAPSPYGVSRYDMRSKLWFSKTSVTDLAMLPHDVLTSDGLSRRESTFHSRTVNISEETCGPRINGHRIPIEDFASFFTEGFSAACASIWYLQADSNWTSHLRDLCQSQPRIILRPTQFYANIAREIYGCYIDLDVSSVRQKFLEKSRGTSPSKEVEAIACAEADAMMLGDIPTFILDREAFDRLALPPVSTSLPTPPASLCELSDFAPDSVTRETNLLKQALAI